VPKFDHYETMGIKLCLFWRTASKNFIWMSNEINFYSNFSTQKGDCIVYHCLIGG
jgi:hypothetical protein